MSSPIAGDRPTGKADPPEPGLIRVWTERPFPGRLRPLLGPDALALGPWSIEGADPVRGVEDADAIIASSRIRYDLPLLRRAVRLRVIARTGTGVDNIDVEGATRSGVAVCNVPDGPTVSTAEQAIALLLAVAKRLKASERTVLAGVWDVFNEHQAVELDGTTLGVVGLGKIGSRVARFGQALGMRLLVWDPYVPAGRVTALGGTSSGSLDDLLRGSDVVTLHVPLTDETVGLLDRRALGLLPPGAIVVNTARGGLIDEAALIEALDTGRLGGAGLDVFAQEPLPPDSPLLGRDDIVVTPHVAAATVASRERLWRAAIDDALRCVRGERPHHIINPEVLGPDGTVPPREGRQA